MKLKFTALGIEFSATVKYTPGHPGSHYEPPACAEVDILTLTHTEHKNGRNDTYNCIFLLNASDTVVDEIMEAAEEAAEEERKFLRECDAMDRADYENERFKDWSAA